MGSTAKSGPVRQRFAPLALGFLAGFAGCSVPQGSVECSTSSICTLAPSGECSVAPSGHHWCRYARAACASGRVWSDEAGDGLAGACVTSTAADAGAEPTPDAQIGPDGRPVDARADAAASASDSGVDAPAPADAGAPGTDAASGPDGGILSSSGPSVVFLSSGGGHASSSTYRLKLVIAPPAGGTAVGTNTTLRLGPLSGR